MRKEIGKAAQSWTQSELGTLIGLKILCIMYIMDVATKSVMVVQS